MAACNNKTPTNLVAKKRRAKKRAYRKRWKKQMSYEPRKENLKTVFLHLSVFCFFLEDVGLSMKNLWKANTAWCAQKLHFIVKKVTKKKVSGFHLTPNLFERRVFSEILIAVIAKSQNVKSAKNVKNVQVSVFFLFPWASFFVFTLSWSSMYSRRNQRMRMCK